VLYLGDNAGESAFDRVLIEVLGKNTAYAVRVVPIINDVTFEDAEKSGINGVARILSSGCDAPGTILKRCSPEFLDLFNKADLIISKGQGSFETLSGEEGPIFFLLKVKCPVIARQLDVRLGEMILGDGRLQAHRPFENRREE
jgi:damage-control phosphatase, subfamily I